MSLTCPKCEAPDRTLDIKERIELPPDSLYDEITIQVIKCTECDFSGVAVYEESRRGSLDDEVSNHYGYKVNNRNLKKLRRMIDQCPEPSNWDCNCGIHKDLGATNFRGRWSGIKKIKTGSKFSL